MVKLAIYFNGYWILFASLFFAFRVLNKNTDLRKARQLVVVYLIWNYISYKLFISDMVDTGWDFLMFFPMSLLSLLLEIVGIIRTSLKIKKLKDEECKKDSLRKFIIISLIPIAIFLIPYSYELYIMNHCTYLLEYYYEGDYTYYAIINDRPVAITLQENIFYRPSVETEEVNYDIEYGDGIEITTLDENHDWVIVENEYIKKIATDAKEKYPEATDASIDYFVEGGYAIVRFSEWKTKNLGTVIGEYFYSGETGVTSSRTHGSLRRVTYYE